MAIKRASAAKSAKKAAGIKSKITAKQRIARKKNIEIARKSRKKGQGINNITKEGIKRQLSGRKATKANVAKAVKEINSIIKKARKNVGLW